MPTKILALAQSVSWVGTIEPAPNLQFAYDIRVFPLHTLREYLEKPPAPRKTAIAASVAANKEHLLTSCESLALLIEEKLAALKERRPNSAAAISDRDDEIEDLERLKRDLHTLKSVISGKKVGKSVDESVISFRDGVQKWWNKHHEKICSKGFDIAMFISAMTVCGLAGAVGPVAVVISGALAGGKSVAEVLKAAGKGLWKRGSLSAGNG